MATSLRKRRAVSAAQAKRIEEGKDQETFSDEFTDLSYHDEIQKKLKQTAHRLSAHTVTQDRYSMSHLAKVLVHGERNEVLNAVDRLRGKSRVLFELACYSTFPYVRLAAVNHLHGDHEALSDIAKYCPHADTRSAALDELSTSSESLVEVACSSFFKDSRLDAIMLLGNTKGLVQVACRSPHIDTRNAVIEKISFDHNSLHKVADESAYRNTRMVATRKLNTNIMILSELILRSKHPEIKKLVAELLAIFIEQIDNIDVLVELARISKNQDVRYLAVGKLWRHSNALRKVVSDSSYKDAKSTALMLLSDTVENVEDHELLVEIANLSPYEDCRAAAVERLVGVSSALVSVATRSKYRDTRNLATQRLKHDSESLRDVFRFSKYRDTRAEAYKIVTSPEVFQGELSKILG